MGSRSSIDRAVLRVVVAAAMVLFTPAPALAQTSEAAGDAEALIKAGLELRRAGRDAEALETFRRALTVSPSPRARAQLALAEQALNLWLECEQDLTAALAANDDPWIRQNRGALERAAKLIAAKLAWITVTSNAPDAMLFVNGRSVGVIGAGRELRVVAGEVVVELRAEDREVVSRTVALVPETKTTIELNAVGRTPGRSDGPRPQEFATDGPPPRSDDESEGLTARRLVGPVAAGVGVVAIGVGSIFGLRAFSLKADRDRECGPLGCTPAGVEADRDGRSAALVSTILVASGVTAVGAGVVLILTRPNQSRSISMSAGPGAVTVHGMF